MVRLDEATSQHSSGKAPPALRRLTAWMLWALLIFAVTSYIVRFSVSDYLVPTNPSTAVKWDPSNAAAYVSVARHSLAAGENEEAIRWAERALEADPIAPLALSLLGTGALASGQTEKGDSLMRIAARIPRDAAANLWLFGREMQNEDFPAAMARVDVLLRDPRPAIQDSVYTILVKLLGSEAGRTIFAKALAGGPAWRSQFIARAATSAAKPADLEELITLLHNDGARFRESELDPLLSRLIREGRAQDAFSVWRVNFPEKTGPNRLYNGFFEHVPSGSPFDWVITAVPGASIKVLPASGELQVAFSGARVPFRNVTHLTTLPAGTYALAAEIRSDSLESEARLQWRVSCASGTLSTVLATLPIAHGTTAWNSVSVTFAVPDEPACSAQTLVLELPTQVVREQQIKGAVYFRKMTLGKASP